MASITLGGTPTQTLGDLPEIQSKAPDFSLTATDLSEKTLNEYKGYRKILNIFPSVDTGVCATSSRNFNEKASSIERTKILCISKDLPFAQSRFCAAEGLENVEMLSDYKTGDFGRNYQLTIADGAFESLLSRVVIVLDEDNKVIYKQQVSEIGEEPDYEAALKVL
jgi:thioredoxin-dependent peroxiredoxin